MKDLIRIFAIFLLLSTIAAAQFDKKDIIVPETEASDSFKVPNGFWYLSAIKLPDGVESDMSPMYFLVSENPKTGWDTLMYDDDGDLVPYSITFTDEAKKTITLDFKKVYAWEWWKFLFSDAPSDSIVVRAIFKEFK